NGAPILGRTPAQVEAALGPPQRKAGFRHTGYGQPTFFYGGKLPSGTLLLVQFHRGNTASRPPRSPSRAAAYSTSTSATSSTSPQHNSSGCCRAGTATAPPRPTDQRPAPSASAPASDAARSPKPRTEPRSTLASTPTKAR